MLWSCLTLFDPMSCSLPGSSVHENTQLGCHALLQGIFPTPGLNPGLMSPALAGGFFTTSASHLRSPYPSQASVQTLPPPRAPATPLIQSKLPVLLHPYVHFHLQNTHPNQEQAPGWLSPSSSVFRETECFRIAGSFTYYVPSVSSEPRTEFGTGKC